MTLTRFAWLTAVLLGLSSTCAATDGRVIDEVTQSPLEGVFVVIDRYASVAYGTESRTSCISFDVAKSGADGRFSVSLPADLLARIVGRVSGDAIAFYKQGYYFVAAGGEGQSFVLRRDPRSSVERHSDMLAVAGRTDCVSGAKKNEKAVPLLRAIYDELRTGATTPAQRKLARDWLLRIDLAEYGSEEGWKRKKARDADWFSRCIQFSRSDPMTGKSEIVVRKDVDRSDCD